jgi:hypothetical protein
VEHQRHREAGEDLQRHRDQGEDEAIAYDDAKGVLVDEVEVVADADPALGIADELVGEGQPDRPAEGIDDQTDDEDEQRQQQEQGGGGLRPLPPDLSPGSCRRFP